MDRRKFSDIAHRDHEIDSPVSSETLDAFVELMRCGPGDPVIDVGCGKGELLVRLAARYGIAGRGIELSEARLVEARRRGTERAPNPEIRWECADAADLAVGPESQAAAICMGAGGAFGGTAGMLRTLAGWVRPGGLVLVDSGYWRQAPAAEYLEVLGASEREYGSHSDNVRLGEEAGLALLYARVASQDDWDHFEGLYNQAIERYATEQPDDSDVALMLDRIRSWRSAYYRWGRDTLGYGLYLFLKPQRPSRPPATFTP